MPGWSPVRGGSRGARALCESVPPAPCVLGSSDRLLAWLSGWTRVPQPPRGPSSPAGPFSPCVNLTDVTGKPAGVLRAHCSIPKALKGTHAPKVQSLRADSGGGCGHRGPQLLRKSLLFSFQITPVLLRGTSAGREQETLDVAATCLHAGAPSSQLLGSPDAGGGFRGVTVSSPKSSSTVNVANYQLIKHISWVYYF